MHYSRLVIAVSVFVSLALYATPAYAIERGTGSYIEYLIAKMQAQGTTPASSMVASSTVASTTRAGGGSYRAQPIMPYAVSNFLQSIRTFSIPTYSPVGSFGGGSSIDVNTYHIIGDPNAGIQDTRGIAQ